MSASAAIPCALTFDPLNEEILRFRKCPLWIDGGAFRLSDRGRIHRRETDSIRPMVCDCLHASFSLFFSCVRSTRPEEELRRRLFEGKEKQDLGEKTSDKIAGYLIGIAIVVLIVVLTQDR